MTSSEDPAEFAPPIPIERLVGTGVGMLAVLIVVSSVIGPDDAAGAPDDWVILALAASVMGRVALLLFRGGRRLLPILDLPILGLVFIVSGGIESPLDPALFVIYTLLVFYTEEEPHRRLAWGYYWTFLFGFITMYGLVFFHLQAQQQRMATVARSQIDEQGVAYQNGLGRVAIGGDEYQASIGGILADAHSLGIAEMAEYFGGQLAIDLSSYAGSLARVSRSLQAIAPRLRAGVSEEEEAEFEEEFSKIDAQGEEMRKLVDTIGNEMQTLSLSLPESAPNEIFHWTGRLGYLLERLGDKWDELSRNRDEFRSFLHTEIVAQRQQELAWSEEWRSLILERVAVAILAMATLSLVAGLRYRFELEVKKREKTRADLELQQREQETENWIALTAGLTHSIGNDILAYDAYGEEALDALAEMEVAPPEVVTHNLQFIHRTNKARLGFIKFLDEFARSRKARLEGTDAPAPRDLSRIPIEEFVMAIRAQVGEVESADLPRDSRDPTVRAHRHKLVDLPLVVEFDSDDAREIRGGRRGILHFFFYELIKNALRNCSGDEPLLLRVSQGVGRVRLRFINDLGVTRATGDDGVVRYRLPRVPELEPCTDAELLAAVEEILDHCFEPGRGGGTGLGLFLIRYFVREYYRGSVSAAVYDWSRHLVAFDIDIPDDLSEAWETT